MAISMWNILLVSYLAFCFILMKRNWIEERNKSEIEEREKKHTQEQTTT